VPGRNSLCPDGESLAIFVLATYGNGEPSDDAVEFHNWLLGLPVVEGGHSPPHPAAGKRFAVFGCGNSEYEIFNGFSKSVDDKLVTLGAQRVEAIGLGDSSKDIEDDFEEWMKVLLAKHVPEGAAGKGNGTTESQAFERLPCKWNVVWNPKEDQVAKKRASLTRRNTKISELERTAAEAEVIGVRKIADRKNPPGTTVEVTLDISDTDLSYHAADTLCVFASNSPKDVEEFGALLNDPLDAPLAVVPVSQGTVEDLPFKCPTTLREVLTHVVDLRGKPKKALVREMAAFATSAAEREELEFITSSAGKDSWSSQIDTNDISLLELFRHYPSLVGSVPLPNFLELVPQMRLAPRYYTIATSPKFVGGGRLSLVVTVLSYVVTKKGDEANPKVFKGVCSNYLLGLKAGARLRVLVQPSHFRLRDPAAPVVLVGTGSGFAPMRALLQEREALKKQGERLGEALLFFGCTGMEDYIYREQIDAWLASGILTGAEVALSRADPKRKTYVQDKIKESAARMAPLLSTGSVFVCGGCAMGKAVKEAVAAVLGGGELAQKVVENMEKEGRYYAELWS
jgi:NADPH-ferrihemoprotein reductase